VQTERHAVEARIVTGPLVQAERRGAFWFVRLNRADKRNALSEPMIGELIAACDAVEADREARAMVLWGAGGSFCAGGDFDRFQELIVSPAPAGVDPIITHNRIFGTLLERVAALPVATLGIVRGAAMGGGVGLACAMDRVIAADDAVFAMPEAALGLAPAQIAPFIARRMGAARGAWHMLAAARFDAQAACAAGIVDRVVAAAGIQDAVTAELTQLARVEPAAMRATKRMARRNESAPLRTALDAAAQDFAVLLRAGRASAGIDAGRERRPPPWHTEVPPLPEFN
jgi:isohexenylglutaconyl-CoA hydratase